MGRRLAAARAVARAHAPASRQTIKRVGHAPRRHSRPATLRPPFQMAPVTRVMVDPATPPCSSVTATCDKSSCHPLGFCLILCPVPLWVQLWQRRGNGVFSSCPTTTADIFLSISFLQWSAENFPLGWPSRYCRPFFTLATCMAKR